MKKKNNHLWYKRQLKGKTKELKDDQHTGSLVTSLPQAPSLKQYQLWTIVDGKPVDAGIIDHSRQRVQRMKVFSKADAFAITLEPKGGSSTRTMEEMYVLGKAS